MAIVMMPKAAMYKDNCFIVINHKVWFTWQVLHLFPERETRLYKQFTDFLLDGCATILNRSHISASRFWIVDISH